jgi:hypothetical protein
MRMMLCDAKSVLCLRRQLVSTAAGAYLVVPDNMKPGPEARAAKSNAFVTCGATLEWSGREQLDRIERGDDLTANN